MKPYTKRVRILLKGDTIIELKRLTADAKYYVCRKRELKKAINSKEK